MDNAQMVERARGEALAAAARRRAARLAVLATGAAMRSAAVEVGLARDLAAASTPDRADANAIANRGSTSKTTRTPDESDRRVHQLASEGDAAQ
jgi:hypothetical protein